MFCEPSVKTTAAIKPPTQNFVISSFPLLWCNSPTHAIVLRAFSVSSTSDRLPKKGFIVSPGPTNRSTLPQGFQLARDQKRGSLDDYAGFSTQLIDTSIAFSI